MRDGVTLFTTVYAPRDTSRAYPFLIHADLLLGGAVWAG